MIRRTPLFLLATFLLLTVTLTLAQPQGQQPPATRVSIILTTGGTIAGELIEATPAGITLRANPRAEPKLTPWSQIRRVGNGLTREKVLADYRANHAELLCDACTGNATQTCAACEGKSVQLEGRTDCATCTATGFSGTCRTPKCTEGQIPCPQTCMKPDDFRGPADAGGRRWKSFRGRTSIHRWSDLHVGELVVMENGEPVNKGKCPTCDGTSRTTDPACKGSGKVTCKTCRGHGVVGTDCNACVEGAASCDACQGTGMKPAATQPTGEPTTEAPAAGTPISAD